MFGGRSFHSAPAGGPQQVGAEVRSRRGRENAVLIGHRTLLGSPFVRTTPSDTRQKEKTCITTPVVARATFETRYPPPALMFLRPVVLMMLASCDCGAANAGRCSSVHTSPLPMDCDPPSAPLLPTAKESARAIIGEVARCLQKHSPSPNLYLETLGLRWQAIGRNESVCDMSSKLLPERQRNAWCGPKRGGDIAKDCSSI